MSRWALITGASSGIGLAFAAQLASEGWNLVLTARREDRLREFAATHPDASVEICRLDLEDSHAAQALLAFTNGRRIYPALLINNAGFGDYGEFHTLDPDRHLAMVQVNCAAVVAITHAYVPRMVERRHGEILIVASTAAFQAVPYQSTYAATKAFDLIFAEGLAQEVKRFGVRVCAVCPGQTRTEFHALANEPIPAGMSVQSAEEVARIGLAALRKGRHYAIAGFGNKLGMEIQRFVPRRVVTAVSERLFRPR